MKRLVLMVFVSIASGCAVRAYQGDVRSSSEVAIVHYDFRYYGFITRRVNVVSVDGEELSRFGRFKLELLPGIHTLAVRYRQYNFGFVRESKTPCWITFSARAGREYYINSETVKDRVVVWLEDKETGERTTCFSKQPGETAFSHCRTNHFG